LCEQLSGIFKYGVVAYFSCGPLYPLNQKWFWQVFAVLLLAVFVPLILFYLVLVLSPSLIIVVLLVAVFIWVIVRSYRRWTTLEKK
jgi:uncharacterized membrane protein YjgN (DUF898 family)